MVLCYAIHISDREQILTVVFKLDPNFSGFASDLNEWF